MQPALGAEEVCLVPGAHEGDAPAVTQHIDGAVKHADRCGARPARYCATAREVRSNPKACQEGYTDADCALGSSHARSLAIWRRCASGSVPVGEP